MNLKFRDDGIFTIVQFADVHNGGATPEDLLSLTLIEEILQWETPDLVVFTGDQIRRGPDPKLQFRQVMSLAEQVNVPYAFVFGNHDSRGSITRQELMAMESERPLCLSVAGPEDVSGTGNYTLTISGSHSSRVETVLYLFDSECNAPEGVGEEKRREWIDPDKKAWYTLQSAAFEEEHGYIVPALAFFHIPLPEYEEVWNTRPCVGNRLTEVRCPQFNTGLFAAMAERGDVMGTFVGHDHSNDYIGELAGIRLCYGRVSGFNSSSVAGYQRGARIIRLREGERSFDTWLRLDDGTVVDQQPGKRPNK